MRGGGYADVLPVLQVPDNKADAVPCERLLQDQGITVSIGGEGLGLYPGISDIFCDHIEAAIAVIPENIHHEFGKSNVTSQ